MATSRRQMSLAKQNGTTSNPTSAEATDIGPPDFHEAVASVKGLLAGGADDGRANLVLLGPVDPPQDELLAQALALVAGMRAQELEVPVLPSGLGPVMGKQRERLVENVDLVGVGRPIRPQVV